MDPKHILYGNKLLHLKPENQKVHVVVTWGVKIAT